MRLILASMLLALAPLSGAVAQDTPIEAIGVPECDAFISRWNTCRLKKPLNERLAMDGAVRQQRAAWMQLGPTRRPMVVQSCQQAAQMFLDGPGCE